MTMSIVSRRSSTHGRPVGARALLLVATIAACDPDDPPATDSPRIDASPAERTAAAHVDPPASLSRMHVVLQSVRSLGDEVQVEVALDRPLPPMASARPELQIGDEVVRRSRSGADGRVDRLIFTMPADQFARMPKDDAIVVRAGVFDNTAAPLRPTLSDVAVIGGAP